MNALALDDETLLNYMEYKLILRSQTKQLKSKMMMMMIFALLYWCVNNDIIMSSECSPDFAMEIELVASTCN